MEQGTTVELVTSADVDAEFQTGPLPVGTYDVCLYGIYASAAGYLLDGLVATIGPPTPTTTTTVGPTTPTTAATHAPVTPRYTG